MLIMEKILIFRLNYAKELKKIVHNLNSNLSWRLNYGKVGASSQVVGHYTKKC